MDVALLRVHVQQLRPWFVRIAGRVEAALVRLLRLFLVMQADAEVTQDFPLQARLAVSDVLSFEVRYLGAEDGPYSEILEGVI